MEPKYICHGERVYQWVGEYVSAAQVARLHGLEPSRCVLVDEGEEGVLVGVVLEEFRVLRPSRDGIYILLGSPSVPIEGVVFHDS